MSEVLRVGFVGCGQHCRSRRAPAVARVASADLVACADVDMGAARQMADEFRIEAVYDSAEELTGSSDVDAVVVAVHHRHLREVALSTIHCKRREMDSAVRPEGRWEVS